MANISEIIKYEGDNGTFIWKHPCEDFNSMTQLIVHESQEAIFFMNGQALDLFGPGRYTLETQNIPLIGKVLNRATGDKTPFHCEVYFINKTEQMSIKWGTDSKVQYIEPTYGFPISIGASGEMSLRAEDSRKLLVRLVGTERDLSQQKLVGFFRAFLMTRVKTYIAQVMKTNTINIFEIDENLTMFSENIHKLLIPDFLGYGVSLERFFVTNIARPDGDRQYEKFKELHFRQYADIAEAKLRQQADLIYAQTEAQKVIIDSQAQAKKREQEGYKLINTVTTSGRKTDKQSQQKALARGLFTFLFMLQLWLSDRGEEKGCRDPRAVSARFCISAYISAVRRAFDNMLLRSFFTYESRRFQRVFIGKQREHRYEKHACRKTEIPCFLAIEILQYKRYCYHGNQPDEDKYKIFLLHLVYLVTTAPSPRISRRSRSIFFSGEAPMPTAFIYLPCEIS